MLTPKQRELLEYINRRIAEDGVSPSFEEMKDALNLRSKSGIHRLIGGLVERGFLRRLANRARALEVLKLPEEVGRSSTGAAAERRPRPIGGASQQMENRLPLYGRIAAGTPIEALRDPDAEISVPAEMLGRGTHYALEVAGDSMIDAGIMDGDTVVIREEARADAGDIVVALVDNQEATLKIFRPEGSLIALEPANDAYETRRLESDRVQVQGRLVGLLRRY